MAVLVCCPRCGAPHRIAASLTRFTCDYCQGLAEVSGSPGVEELVVPLIASPVAAQDQARRALLLAGARRFRIHVEPPRSVAMWQIVSRAGEEHVLPAPADALPGARLLRLPAAPLVQRGDPRAAGLEPLPQPGVDLPHALAAARAAFEEPEAPIEAARLVWLSVAPLTVETSGATVRGFYLAGAERVLLEPLPDAALQPPVDGRRVQFLAAFLTLSLLAGVAVHDPAWRAAAGGCLLGAGLLASRAGRRSL